MEFVQDLIEIVFHIDKHLNAAIDYFGPWMYAILFLIIFAETGLVVTPFLPGDSLLFAVGTFAALGAFDPLLLFLLLSAAAILGDSLNYALGKMIGPKVFHQDQGRFLKKAYLLKTQAFYEKYGGKTIVLARFMPIIRTFAPFVAGIGTMNYARFLFFNVSGGFLWVSIFVFGGYFFGNIPVVKNNFAIVILAIIFLSILPGIIEFYRHKKRR